MMTQAKASPSPKESWNQAARVGLWFGLGLSVYGLAFRLAELHHNSIFAWVFYLALPVAAWLTLKRLRIRGISPKFVRRAWIATCAAGRLTALVYCLYVWGFNALIDDSLLQNSLLEARADIAGRNYSED